MCYIHKKQVLKPVFLGLLVGFYQKKRLMRFVFLFKIAVSYGLI
ncbi:hypothetical protein AO375_0824 [Moraxella catarrhalis]|nr:hypothetical protein AO375_0824 [Moraxella catarrhalis]